MEEDFYITEISKNPKNRIWMKGGIGTKSLIGFIDADVQFGAQANWDVGEVGAELLNKGLEKINGGKTVMGQSNLRSIYSSMQTWQTSSFNPITMDIFIIATTDSQNVLLEANKVWDYVLPIDKGWGIVSAPGGYTPASVLAIAGYGEGQTGQVSIKIGDWFYSPNAWVASSATLAVSKQRVKASGFPLYIKITLTLNPSRMFHAEEVKKWYRTT